MDNLNDISFQLYQHLYYSYMASQRPDIQQLYQKYSSLDKTDSTSTSTRFTRTSVDKDESNDAYPSLISFKQLDRRQGAPGKRDSLASNGDNAMTLYQFHRFLQCSQYSEDFSITSAEKILHKCNFDLEGSSQISLAGFVHCVMTMDSLPNISKLATDVDESHPISSYFISSSHNTYLTGHQLHGESSASMYGTVSVT